MKRNLIFFTLLAVCLQIGAITVETASFTDFVFGSTEDTAYDDWYHRVVEGLASAGYNQYAPWNTMTNGFGNFESANSTQRSNWGVVVNHFYAQEFSEAQDAIDYYEFPYEVVQFNDTDTGRTYYMLREFLNMDYFDDNNLPDQPQMHQHGSFDYGWGLYVFNPDSDNPINVNVVHPLDDFIVVPVTALAFQIWDARHLMINAAGREVLWTNVPPYWNSKSLSDPSRNLNHVFNVTYQAGCDEIRNTFNRREFSAQIHSYDYTHTGYNHLQITAGGWDYDYPGLPIRDISGNNLDLINSSPYVIHPANIIGIHDDITISNHYSVLYGLHGLNYYLGDEIIPVSNNINLPGATDNRQVQYTTSGWNDYDVSSPFFHIELEELPTIYPQTMNYYRWLYGFDAVSGLWDRNDLFTRTLEFYTPWLYHMEEALNHWVEFDDGVPPTDPSSLIAPSTSYNNIVLEWERSYSYDFKTYEILIATEPIDMDNPNYVVIDRSTISTLAGQAFTRATVTGLNPNTHYYFRIRALDYNDNYSEVSNQATRFTGVATITNLSAYGRDGYVDISWLAQYQSGNLGFQVLRAISGTDDYDVIDSWETNSNLEGSTQTNVFYSIVDNSAENGVVYDYKVASVDQMNFSHNHIFVASASAQPIYSLTFQNGSGTISDTVEFGVNPFATDGYNNNFDIVKSSNPGGEYIYAMSYHSNWSTAVRSIQRDIYGFYDHDQDLKTWTLRLSSNQTGQPISISISDNYARNSEKLYLRCTTTGAMVDLTEEPLVIEVSNTNYRYFTLYWGNLLPSVNIASMSNSFRQANEVLNFGWSYNFSLLINSLDLYLSNGTDSLHIESNLAPTTTSYSWTVPNNINMQNASLVVRTNLLDGYPMDHYSQYKLGIVPSTHSYTTEAGWHLKANPFVSPSLPASIVFGNESLLYSYNSTEEEYELASTFNYGTGYSVYVPTDHEIGTTGTIRNLQYDIPLNQGWNLIPNIFMGETKIADLRVIHNSLIFTFMEALQYDMIDRGIFGIENDAYALTSKLRTDESFWIYAHVDGILLRVTPFHVNPDYDDFPVNWQVAISARQDGHLRDEIVVGSASNTTDEYDKLFDLPKPPAKPGHLLNFYIDPDPAAHDYDRLHSEFKAELDSENDDSRYWDFVLELEEPLQPIYFSKSSFNLPDNYRVVLISDDIYLVLSEDEFQINPNSTIMTGQIKVTNMNVTSVDEETPSASVKLGNYPNPFFSGVSRQKSPGTRISFFLPQKEKVKLEIFNIKGQRVVTLLDDSMESGDHFVQWSGTDNQNKTVASGVYFYRLSVGKDEAYNRKMLLLK
jgi:hypothetical protein